MRLKLLLCLAKTGVKSPLNAIFEQTKTRQACGQAETERFVVRVANADRETAAIHLGFKIENSKHLHAVIGSGIFFVHHGDVAKAQGFNQCLNNLVVRDQPPFQSSSKVSADLKIFHTRFVRLVLGVAVLEDIASGERSSDAETHDVIPVVGRIAFSGCRS